MKKYIALILFILITVLLASAQESPPCVNGDIWDMQMYGSRLYLGCGGIVWSHRDGTIWQVETVAIGDGLHFFTYNNYLRVMGDGAACR